MGRTIRDYEYSGKLGDIIKMTRKYNVYERISDLRWHPVTETPIEGQKLFVCRKGWAVNFGFYADGMFFHEGWDWADEFTEFDGWMTIPLPLNYKEENV